MRLARMVVDHWWEVDGWATAHGMPPLGSLSVGRLASFAQWWALQGADQVQKARFDGELWRPPAGVVATAGPWSADAENMALSGLKRQLGM